MRPAARDMIAELRMVLGRHTAGDIAVNVEQLRRWLAALTDTPSPYATCRECGRAMAPGTGCTGSVDQDKRFVGPAQRLPYGHETRVCDIRTSDTVTCVGCNVRLGQYHHGGCDIEECPICHGQLIACGCARIDQKVSA